MSNLIVGDIFEKIIEEVVLASQTDFEENGVNQQTLLELKQTWHQKLSVRKVAEMPWDPKPAPAPAAPPAQSSSAQSSAPNYASNGSSSSQTTNGVRVKTEGTDSAFNGNFVQPNPPTMNPELAQQRAASLLQQQYGSQASASLGAMQQRGIALPGQQAGQQQKAPGSLQLPGQQSAQTLQQQYAQQLKQQQAAQQPRIKTEPDAASDEFQAAKRQRLAYAQTDGADEWDRVVAHARSVTDEARLRNDETVRDRIAQGSRELESGLMQPLSSRAQPRPRKSRSERPQREGIPQLDGEYSDDGRDEDDENAINSDLDSSGDEGGQAEEDDDEIDSMLCTYDKVQRVKNKWKCVLKDGVLSANGKEYIFHKAQGEFEW